MLLQKLSCDFTTVPPGAQILVSHLPAGRQGLLSFIPFTYSPPLVSALRAV